MHSIIQNNLTAIRELCVKHNVERLYLFGSALGDDFKPGESDVDFAAEYRDIDPVTHMKSFFGLINDLEELLQHQVDVVEFKAIRNPYFLRSVEETKTIVFDAERTEQVSV